MRFPPTDCYLDQTARNNFVDVPAEIPLVQHAVFDVMWLAKQQPWIYVPGDGVRERKGRDGGDGGRGGGGLLTKVTSTSMTVLTKVNRKWGWWRGRGVGTLYTDESDTNKGQKMLTEVTSARCNNVCMRCLFVCLCVCVCFFGGRRY